jgi:hypothetical protein
MLPLPRHTGTVDGDPLGTLESSEGDLGRSREISGDLGRSRERQRARQTLGRHKQPLQADSGPCLSPPSTLGRASLHRAQAESMGAERHQRVSTQCGDQSGVTPPRVPEAGQPHAPLLPAVSSHVLNPQRCARTRLLLSTERAAHGSSHEPHGLASLYLYPEGLSSYCNLSAKT